jgi:hypothetical protein
MIYDLEDNEVRLILLLLDKVTVKLNDTEAVPISIAAHTLLSKLQLPAQLEVVKEPQSEEVA